MPSLSYKKLHGRGAILRALGRAGQFAHVPIADIGERLDNLYDVNYRLRIGHTHAAHELAVPFVLVKARESRLFAEPHFDARTVDFLAYVEGVVCCLCLQISRPVGGAGLYGVPKGFIMHVCPTFLRAEGRDAFDDQPPLCLDCRRAVANRLWRENGMHKVPDTPDLWSSILAWLAANTSFRARVSEHSVNLHGIRFDPRRIPTWGKGPITIRQSVCKQCGSSCSPRAQTCRECFRQAAPAAAQARSDKRRRAA